MPWLPNKNLHDWPKDAVNLPVSEIKKMYRQGFAGAKRNEKAIESFHNAMSHPDGDEVPIRFGFDDSGAGKLVLTHHIVMSLFPDCWPSPAQGRGSCVAHSTRNACLTSMACDIKSGVADEKTGEVEGVPEISETGVKQGVLSTEAIYWYRGYDADGWYCHAAAEVATKVGGCVLRQNYPGLGVDLTKYSARTEGKYGRRKPPQSIQTETKKHLIHEAAEIRSVEAIRDFLYNGKGVSSCGGEGYESTRNEHGVSKQRGSWAHAMAVLAVDDRDIIKRIYNYPLVLILNSWDKWNRGPRDIYKSASLVPAHLKEEWTALGIVNPQTGNIMIPHGAFWTPWNHCRRREYIGFGGANGWKANSNLLDWSTAV